MTPSLLGNAVSAKSSRKLKYLTDAEGKPGVKALTCWRTLPVVCLDFISNVFLPLEVLLEALE